MADLWRLDELQSRTAAALQAAAVGEVESGRVRDVPDARTIRYYTTLGLIDRPSEMRGRTAYYGRRHVLQLVAIKRLQAAGNSLAEVQRQLVGATDRRLTELAAVPEEFWQQPLAEAVADQRPPPKSRSREKEFWLTAAAPAAEIREVAPRAAVPITAVRIPVAEGVTLELTGEAVRQLSDANLADLKPLLEELAKAFDR
jgi:DNA-binding transcriptional MerR regulator